MDATVSEVREEPFPAKTKQATGTINGVPTEATSISFSDRIVVTISQEGRLSQWVSNSHFSSRDFHSLTCVTAYHQ